MSKNTENYRKSLYLSTKVLSSRQECTVEKVVNSFDGGIYVRRTYKDDKTEIFRLLAEIKSPYLPEIVEIFSGGGETVVIEKYIEGETLASAIANKKLTKTSAKNAARQLLCALEAVQKIGLVHRDIKPENIMLSDGKLTLIDFGIARIYKENETRDTKHLGTEGYAAPEQYGFSQSDKRTDIYSAGKTILKMCEAAGLNGILKKTALRCSQFDPQNRFETAHDALKYLENRKSLFCASAAICLAICALALLVSRYPVRSDKNISSPAEIKIVTVRKTEENTKRSENAKTERPAEIKQPDKSTKPEKREEIKQPKKTANRPQTDEQAEKKETVSTEEDEASYNPVISAMGTMLNGAGRKMLLSYKGEVKNSASAETDFENGNIKNVTAQIEKHNLNFNIGGQKLAIPFGRYIQLYNGDASAIDACVKFCDLDGDGVKEIFAEVCSRHGFCVEQSALWFAKQINGEFAVCDAPLNYNGAKIFTLLPKDHAIADEFSTLYRINGTKFEKVK